MGLLLAFVCSTSRAIAQDSTAATPVRAPQAAAPGVPVVLLGDTLFRVYGALGPFGPEERAEAIAQRLRALSTFGTDVADSIVALETEGAVVVRAGETVVMSVTPADAAGLGLPALEAGRAYADALRAALQEEKGFVRLILVGIGWTVLATAGLAAVLWLLRISFGAIRRRLEAWGSRQGGLRVQQLELLSAFHAARAPLWLARALRPLAGWRGFWPTHRPSCCRPLSATTRSRTSSPPTRSSRIA